MFDLDVFTAGNDDSECEAWPAPRTRDEPRLADVEVLPERLVVSVSGGPATPHEGGIAMAQALDGSLLTVDGKQLGTYFFGGSECVDDAVNAYLVDLETTPVDACCSLWHARCRRSGTMCVTSGRSEMPGSVRERPALRLWSDGPVRSTDVRHGAAFLASTPCPEVLSPSASPLRRHRTRNACWLRIWPEG